MDLLPTKEKLDDLDLLEVDSNRQGSVGSENVTPTSEKGY